MPNFITLRRTLIATGSAVALVVIGGIAGFLSHAYLEIWFENADKVKIADLSTWPKIAQALSANFDVTSPQTYRAYYGENTGGGHTGISKADFVLKEFQITGKIIGAKIKFASDANYKYTIIGFRNSRHVVLTQRGPLGGVGTFFMKTQDAQNHAFFVGNFLTEDIKEPGGNERWVTQCPIVMTSEALANQFYPTPEAAVKAFGFLQTKCTEYKMPTSIDSAL